MFQTILLIAFSLYSLIYTISHRTVGDFLTYPTYIASILILALLVDYVSRLKKAGLKNPPNLDISLVLSVCLLVALLSTVYYSIGVTLKDIYLATDFSQYNSTFSSIFISIGTLVSGALLFDFRAKHRWFYGLSEVLVGVIIVNYRLNVDNITTFSHNAEFYLAILSAGIYLVVRGFDNMHIGFNDANKLGNSIKVKK